MIGVQEKSTEYYQTNHPVTLEIVEACGVLIRKNLELIKAFEQGGHSAVFDLATKGQK